LREAWLSIMAFRILLLLLFLMIALFIIDVVRADDSELLIAQAFQGDTEFAIITDYSYSLYGLEVIDIVNPGLGGVGSGFGGVGRDLLVSPRYHEVLLAPGGLSSSELLITNLGQSSLRVSVSVLASSSEGVRDRVYLNGERVVSGVLIPSAGYDNNFLLLPVSVSAPVLPVGVDRQSFVVDLLVSVDGASVREYHTLKVVVERPGARPPLFSVLGGVVVERAVTVCDSGDGFGERVVCEASVLVSRSGLRYWHLLVFSLLLLSLFVFRRRSRVVSRVVDRDVFVPVRDAGYVVPPAGSLGGSPGVPPPGVVGRDFGVAGRVRPPVRRELDGGRGFGRVYRPDDDDRYRF